MARGRKGTHALMCTENHRNENEGAQIPVRLGSFPTIFIREVTGEMQVT